MRRRTQERARPASHYAPNAAARHLLSRVPTAHPSQSVATARKALLAGRWDTVNYVYVLDEERHVVGVASMKELLAAPGTRRMGAFRTRKLAVAHPHSDMRTVSARAIAANVKMLPVVDHDGSFLGVVGTDSILETLENEHVRSVLSASGLSATRTRFADLMGARVAQLIAWRTPWLVAGLAGGMLATLMVDVFREDLERVIALAFFIPAILYMGAAVGTQTQVIYVRSLALEAFDKRRYLRREMLVDAAMGATCALLIGPFAYLLTGSKDVACAVAISILLVMSSAGTVAIAVPELLRRFGRDPAVGGGPFTTIVQDLLSLFIYFAVASWLLL